MTEEHVPPPRPADSRAMPNHRAEDLMEGGQAAHISLGDQLYTLRITRAGKLILTK